VIFISIDHADKWSIICGSQDSDQKSGRLLA